MFLRRITPREEICTGEGGLACETNNQPIPFPGCRSNLPISGRDIFKRCAPEKNEKLSIYCAFVFRTQGFPSRMLCLGGEGRSVPSSWGVYGCSAFLQDLQAISVS